ncbi:MAG: BrnA antitoxin family protein [Edaphobacter sp.]
MKKSHIVRYRREPGTPLTAKQIRELKALEGRPVDTSDIPEWTEEMWKRAVRGTFYRPVKKAVSLRLDADVIAWLKKDGKGYQTRANRVLREKMLNEMAG